MPGHKEQEIKSIKRAASSKNHLMCWKSTLLKKRLDKIPAGTSPVGTKERVVFGGRKQQSN